MHKQKGKVKVIRAILRCQNFFNDNFPRKLSPVQAPFWGVKVKFAALVAWHVTQPYTAYATMDALH
jgi:hypothetical protein